MQTLTTPSLDIPAGSQTKEPIMLRPTDDGPFLIHIGANASATIIEELSGSNSRHYALTIRAEANSTLRMITLQTMDPGATLEETRDVFLEQGATVHLLGAHFGGASVKSTVTQTAKAPHATPKTDLIAFTQGKEHMEFNLKNTYEKPNGLGEIYAKGAAKDHSQLTINGMIHIGPDGGGTNTTMHEHTLLLSKDATVKATPALEIDTNDVKASHGASVSNLSDEVVFYAASRGIPAEEARRLMARGFLSERLSAISDLPELYDRILDYL